MAINGQTGSPHTLLCVLILFIFDPSPSVVFVSPYYLLPRKLPKVSKHIIFSAFHCFGGHVYTPERKFVSFKLLFFSVVTMTAALLFDQCYLV